MGTKMEKEDKIDEMFVDTVNFVLNASVTLLLIYLVELLALSLQ